MDKITLKDYFTTKGIKRGNYRDFAIKCGVSLSYISKLLHGDYGIKVGTLGFKKVKEVVAADGYDLITTPDADLVAASMEIELRELRKKNQELEELLTIKEKTIEKISNENAIMKKVFKHIKIANTMLENLEKE